MIVIVWCLLKMTWSLLCDNSLCAIKLSACLVGWGVGQWGWILFCVVWSVSLSLSLSFSFSFSLTQFNWIEFKVLHWHGKQMFTSPKWLTAPGASHKWVVVGGCSVPVHVTGERAVCSQRSTMSQPWNSCVQPGTALTNRPLYPVMSCVYDAMRSSGERHTLIH